MACGEIKGKTMLSTTYVAQLRRACFSQLGLRQLLPQDTDPIHYLERILTRRRERPDKPFFIVLRGSKEWSVHLLPYLEQRCGIFQRVLLLFAFHTLLVLIRQKIRQTL